MKFKYYSGRSFPRPTFSSFWGRQELTVASARVVVAAVVVALPRKRRRKLPDRNDTSCSFQLVTPLLTFVRSGAPALRRYDRRRNVRRAAKQFFSDFSHPHRTQQEKILWPKDGANFVYYSSVPRSLSPSISAIFQCSAAVGRFGLYAEGGSGSCGRLIARWQCISNQQYTAPHHLETVHVKI